VRRNGCTRFLKTIQANRWPGGKPSEISFVTPPNKTTGLEVTTLQDNNKIETIGI
jgi:hypothetical protein